MNKEIDFFLEPNIPTGNKPIKPKEFKSEQEKEDYQRLKTFNGMTAKEWTLASLNIWSDLSSPRNEYQKEHGAVFPVKLAERLIAMYSGPGDVVFDPFLGIGSTMIAAQNLERHFIGTELNERFADLATQWSDNNLGLLKELNKFNYKVVNDDCRNLDKYMSENKIQLTVTSPPYADFIQRSVEDRQKFHKTSLIALENNSTVKQYSTKKEDFGNLPYLDFINQMKEVLLKNYKVTKKGGYSCWVVKDHRDTKNGIPYIPFHSDLARAGEETGWKYHDLIIWDQSKQRSLVLLGYPSTFYTNQNCSFIVVFRKS
jgi:DNA modification methylase